jgi:hypothetical protein
MCPSIYLKNIKVLFNVFEHIFGYTICFIKKKV